MVIAVGTMGCFALHHTVGDGGRKMAAPVTTRQWFVLFGLVPLNKIDSKDLAGDAKDYTVKTVWAPLDIVMNVFTGYITVYSRTIEVYK